MVDTYTTAWQTVSDGDTTTIDTSSLTPNATGITDAQIQWRGIQTSNTSQVLDYTGWNEKTIENSQTSSRSLLNGITETDSVTYSLGNNFFIGEGPEGTFVSGEFRNHTLEVYTKLPEWSELYSDTALGQNSATITVQKENDNTSNVLDKYEAEVTVEGDQYDGSNETDVTITYGDGSQQTYTITTDAGVEKTVDSWTKTDGSNLPEDISVTVSNGATVRDVKLYVDKYWYETAKIYYTTFDGTEKNKGYLLDGTGDGTDYVITDGDGWTQVYSETTTTPYLNETREDEAYKSATPASGIEIYVRFETSYYPYTWVDDVVSAPSPPSGYDYDGTGYDINVRDGKITFQRLGDTGEWSAEQITSSDVGEFVVESSNNDLQIATAIDAKKVDATGRVRTRGKKTTTTYYDTDDPSVGGDVSGAYYGQLTDNETSTWEPLSGLAVGSNSISHSIGGSGEAEYRIEYTYAAEPPQPSLGVVGFYNPNDDTWYEVAVADPTNDRLVSNALQINDGNGWGAIDVVGADHPDAIPFTAFENGTEWLAFREYSTT